MRACVRGNTKLPVNVVVLITNLLVIQLVHCADDGSPVGQPDDVQSADDSVQKRSSHKLIFSDNFEGSSRLR